jgi:hypothetical protein
MPQESIEVFKKLLFIFFSNKKLAPLQARRKIAYAKLHVRNSPDQIQFKTADSKKVMMMDARSSPEVR